MKTNVAPKSASIFTEEGAVAKKISPYLQLRRSVLCCMLWENNAYEDGVSIVKRIKDLIQVVEPELVAKLAKEAREKMKLRHVPLLLCRELARIGRLKPEWLTDVIQRADEISEFMAIYRMENPKEPIAKSVKVGLGQAFDKFSEYEFGKYKGTRGIFSVRDVMFLVHPKPSKDKEALYKKIADDKLEVPDTWEVALSGGADKNATFTRLINDNKLGGLAMLRNLRNMEEAKVERKLINKGLSQMNTSRILPFRFIAAAKYAPSHVPQIEEAMLRCLKEHTKLKGTTVIVIDNSGSMRGAIGGKSELTRVEAAGALAILIREICEDPIVLSFSRTVAEVTAHRGFALAKAVNEATEMRDTYTKMAIDLANTKNYDRIIVISDEQTATTVPDPICSKAYFINVSNNKNGVGYGKWTHIDGWSESVVDYIIEYENEPQ